MKNFKPFLSLSLFLSLLFIFGCSNDAVNNQINFGLIVSEKTLPANFHEIAFERKEAPLFRYLVRKVVNQSEFEDTWNLYEFNNKIPKVDLNEGDVFFIGVHESGSCPYKVRNIKQSSDNKTLTVTLSEPEGACTSDAAPRTFVIQIAKEISNDLESVVIVQNEVETRVPFE